MAMAGDTYFVILRTKALTNELQNKDDQFSGSIILNLFKYESVRVFFSFLVPTKGRKIKFRSKSEHL